MIAWWMGLPAPIRKALTYAGIAIVAGVVIFYCIRRYGVAQYEKGAQEKAIKMYNEMIKQKEVEWADREAVLAKEDAERAIKDRELSLKESQLTEATVALEKQRREMNRTLTNALNKIQDTLEGNNATIMAIPDDRLVDAVRTKSAELASRPAGPTE